MCLAIPGKIIEVDGKKAKVQYPGESKTILTGGENVKCGDLVMVQMGVIVKILSPKEIHQIYKK